MRALFSSLWGRTLLLLSIWTIGTCEASAQLVANGKSLIVTTTNSVANFTGADLVGLKNSLTNELYLKNPSGGELAAVNTMSGPAPLTISNWTIGPEPITGVPLASITLTESIRTMTLSIKIDAATQEIVIKLAASVSTPGLRDASWSFAGLDLGGGRLIVPANTGVAFDATHNPLGQFLEYPNTWHAQMAVYQGNSGSFVLYSTDTQGIFKQLRSSTRGSSSVDLAIVTEAIAPFPSATAVPTIEWRLKSFTGDWRNAAQVYKDWLTTNRPPVSNSAHPWVSNIRAVVGIRSVDASLLSPLAAKVVPSQTLLYIHDWTVNPFGYNFPNYVPRANVASFVASAQALGFKVMLHFDMVGVSPGNPDYASMQVYQVKTPDTLQPTGWLWQLPPGTNGRYAFISPAASAWRSLLITRITTAVNAVHPDALHMDISGPLDNDGNGLIGGLTFPQGANQLHLDLIAAFPSLALGGEAENDILYRYQSFAQAWPNGDFHTPGHPIANFLFSPQVKYYGHLGQPQATEPTFITYLSQIEHQSILPQLPIVSQSDLDTTNLNNARLIGIVRSWQDHAFQPDWAGDWTGALVRYSGTGSTSAALSDSGTLEMLTGAGSTLYQISHDVDQLTTTSFAANWPAFDNTVLYGFDPAQKYWLDSVPRPATTHATNLPPGDRIGGGTLVSSGFGLFEVNPPVPGTFDFFGNFLLGTPGVRYQGVDGPLANGAAAFLTNSAVGGVNRQVIFIHPPFSGQPGGETFEQYSVPASAGAQFQFSVGIQDGAACTDGVTFRVTANGTEFYNHNFLLGAWHDGVVDLSSFAGTTVALRIISNPGAQNNANCDWGVWSQFAIVYPVAIPTISVPLVLANGSTFSGFAGDGSFTLNAPLSGTVSNLSLPGRFVVFTQPGSVVTNGTNLLNLPFQVWSTSPGHPAGPGSVYNAGTVTSAAVGGVTKNPAVNAIPPSGGRTILSWTLNLPNASALRLGWSAGVQDGNSSNDGMDFLVLINGVQYWKLTTQINQWASGNIDLQQWKGQNVLVELVTDAHANNAFDAGLWADLVLTTSAVTCTYSLPSGIAIGSAGGQQLTLNVTTSAGCPWASTTRVPWLSIAQPDAGIGNGTVSYSVAPNPGPPRSGTMVIAGHTFVVNQSDANGIFLRKTRTGQITSQ